MVHAGEARAQRGDVPEHADRLWVVHARAGGRVPKRAEPRGPKEGANRVPKRVPKRSRSACSGTYQKSRGIFSGSGNSDQAGAQVAHAAGGRGGMPGHAGTLETRPCRS